MGGEALSEFVPARAVPGAAPGRAKVEDRRSRAQGAGKRADEAPDHREGEEQLWNRGCVPWSS